MIFSLDKKKADMQALYEDSGIILTYGQLCEEVERFGIRIPERSLVFILCQNAIGSVVGYLSCLNGNHVAFMLDAEMDGDMLIELMENYQPQYILVPDDRVDEISIATMEIIYHKYQCSLLATGYASFPMYSELRLLLSTSGSIGNPKTVRISKKNIEANAASIKEYLNLTEEERPITTLPMQYTYVLSVINSHLLAGGCILLTQKNMVQQEFWEFLEDGQATSFAGVPFTYEILKRIKMIGKKLPGITSMTQAGGKLPQSLQTEVALWAKEQQIRFYIMYGQTEATARMSYLPYEMCLLKPGSIGIPIPGGTFRIKTEDATWRQMQEAPVEGELIYEGENVSLGYAQNKEDLKLEDERCGILETGDIARKDSDGFYYIVGRKKRFIKIHGVRIGLDECEQLLLNRYQSREFACVGEDDCLRIYTNDAGISEIVCEWLAEILKVNISFLNCVLIPTIPKNDAGKIRYSALP